MKTICITPVSPARQQNGNTIPNAAHLLIGVYAKRGALANHGLIELPRYQPTESEA